LQPQKGLYMVLLEYSSLHSPYLIYTVSHDLTKVYHNAENLQYLVHEIGNMPKNFQQKNSLYTA
ncbi:MAG: hypothetical protein COV71_02250, partial [Candidatus Omnitrophica bacterium CG11_big_fil_rev_8_21_14_0_20_41_12]